MKLNNIWGYGQLFGFSGLEGVNQYQNDFIGTLTAKKIGVRFELNDWVKVQFPIKGRIKFKAVLSDLIHAQTKDGEFIMTFVNANTIIGYSPVLPKITGQKKLTNIEWLGKPTFNTRFDSIAVQYEETDRGYKYCIARSQSYGRSAACAKRFLATDVDALVEKRYDYYKKMPKCKNKKYEKLYYKALSVNKVNVHSPEGNIPCRWTTPDRVPHRHMWLWDSVFHALAMVTYNHDIAKDAIRAVLLQQWENGFQPNTMTPIDSCETTQPQVLAWGVWEVYKKTGDVEFLKESIPALEAYLEWDIKNRDENGNGLLEWRCDPNDLLCKCGESGLDDSPRFDFCQQMDAVDFSAFLCHDAEYMAKIFAEVGDDEKAKKWLDINANIKAKINELLWDKEDGVYYDRLFDGNFSKVLTPASFFPMFAGVPTQEMANKMVEVLLDEKLLWTKAPLASVSQTHPTFEQSMWRGGVWLNLNYFVLKGLLRYGFTEQAEKLKNATLEMVNKWYKKTGAIFEFFDPLDEIYPYQCNRKGWPTTPPDWRKHVHSIVDFNWSACFTLMMIQDELYIK